MQIETELSLQIMVQLFRLWCKRCHSLCRSWCKVATLFAHRGVNVDTFSLQIVVQMETELSVGLLRGAPSSVPMAPSFLGPSFAGKAAAAAGDWLALSAGAAGVEVARIRLAANHPPAVVSSKTYGKEGAPQFEIKAPKTHFVIVAAFSKLLLVLASYVLSWCKTPTSQATAVRSQACGGMAAMCLVLSRSSWPTL